MTAVGTVSPFAGLIWYGEPIAIFARSYLSSRPKADIKKLGSVIRVHKNC